MAIYIFRIIICSYGSNLESSKSISMHNFFDHVYQYKTSMSQNRSILILASLIRLDTNSMTEGSNSEMQTDSTSRLPAVNSFLIWHFYD